jgi:hypothetical protein
MGIDLENQIVRVMADLHMEDITLIMGMVISIIILITDGVDIGHGSGEVPLQ